MVLIIESCAFGDTKRMHRRWGADEGGRDDNMSMVPAHKPFLSGRSLPDNLKLKLIAFNSLHD